MVGTWEQDLNSRTLMVVPELFQHGQKAQGLNSRIYLRWFGNAIITGMIAYAGCWAGYAGSELIDDPGLLCAGVPDICSLRDLDQHQASVSTL